MKTKGLADKDLAGETARFHELATQSLEWVWETDAQGNLTYCSPSCKALYGYEPRELLGRDIIETLIPPEDREEQRKIIEEIRLSRKPRTNLRRQGMRKNGSVIPIETNCLPVLAGNIVLGFRGMSRDISEVMLLELRLKQKARELAEVNNALSLLLHQSAEASAEHERRIHNNLQRLVLPYLEKIQDRCKDEELALYLRVAAANLEKITSTFCLTLSVRLKGLTPRELEVAELIKQGRSTKQVAAILDLSCRTVEFYRDQLRVKLGIKSKKTNLRSYLSSLA
ncbi:MAG: PAS domain-containing protein [Desulfurivibrionaceae bacterium]|jgi:PAS domain S-box-containing protein|nr:PAS domain S-box protein [Pseudomonadota bacterium]MCG2822908.1 PAS domain S-box protein [Desulfobulbaceae bacterium]MDP2001717.1 PAS domain S-box protein [Desulfurivibrionaceae bacterium]MBU4229341.1 PAS domain S-box protein [Pseudomonadota bacterium]MBU4407273.1 PAS domain S-box protein [Pseudomonadota bacterium]